MELEASGLDEGLVSLGLLEWFGSEVWRVAAAEEQEGGVL